VPKKEPIPNRNMATIAASAGKTLAQLRAERAAAQTKGRVAAAPAPPPESIFRNVTRGDEPTLLKFTLSPTHVSYANTLRRTMITDVETIAFRANIMPDGSTADVKISKNSTPMSNEMLAHRIGLIPLHISDPINWNPDDFAFKLEVKNDSSEPRDVVTGDIEVYKNRGPEEEPLKVPSLEFFHPDRVTQDTILLAVLKGRLGSQESEMLSFTARATIGTGREHTSFMPVTSRCAYGYTRDDDPDRRKEFFTRWLQTYKMVNPSELESNDVKKGELEREFNTMEIQRVYKMDERGEPYSFDFLVESVGVLDPVYVVGRAIDILVAKLLQYASVDAGDLPEGLKVLPADARMKGFDFTFQGEDHTLGNLLQTYMEQNQVDTEQITFVGYKVPHPLRDEMVLRVGVDSGKDSDARAAVAKAARECAQMFKGWAAMWAGSAPAAIKL
jgi:DNA-directed RNA polymerase subunit L/DNA-directed RNA polymerase alpha subunit